MSGLSKMKPITKTVTTTYTPEWIKKEFTVYGPEFRKARERQRKKYNRCFACNTPFQDGDVMALGGFGKHGNKALCQTCASDISQQEEDS